MLKLLVVEDHALVREGLVQTLRQLEADVIVFEAADRDAANRRLQELGTVDLMLLDLGLPRLDVVCPTFRPCASAIRRCRWLFSRPSMIGRP